MSSTQTEAKGSTSTKTKVPITVAKGDGIGPEIMDATLFILNAAGARIEIEEIERKERAIECIICWTFLDII